MNSFAEIARTIEFFSFLRIISCYTIHLLHETRISFFSFFFFREIEKEISIALTRRKFVLAPNHMADRCSEFKYLDCDEIK